MFLTYFTFHQTNLLCDSVLTISSTHGIAVKYEACLDDGTLVAKSDGVEFAVKDGQWSQFLSVS